MKLPNQVNNSSLIAASLVLGFSVSIALYFTTEKMVVNSELQQFKHQSSNAQIAIRTRVTNYADVLHGLGALFQTSDTLSRAQFHRYIANLNLQKYPGIRNLNFSQFVSAADKTAFETSVRQDRSLDPAGYPDFAIRPPGVRNSYNVLTYVEPMQGFESSFGLDISSNQPGATALANARDSGKVLSSGRLILRDGSKSAGLAMRLPIYRNGMPLHTVEERRAAYIGSVGAGFNVEKLLNGVLHDVALRHLRFRLYDTGSTAVRLEPGTTSDDRLLFDSNPESASTETESDNLFSARIPMEIGGRVWESHFSASHKAMLSGIDPYLPWLAFFSGMLGSFLLFSVLHSLASSRRRAVEIAEVMTKGMRESEASLADAQHMAHLGNWLLNPGTGAMTWSAETYRIFGLDPKQTEIPKYAEFMQRMHEQDRVLVREALDRTLSTGKEFSAEHRITHRDGKTRWVQTISRPGLDTQQGLLRGTIMDITDRKQAMLQSEIEHRVAQIVATSDDVNQVMPKVIEALCSVLGWKCGVYRVLVENSMRLRCAQYWGMKTLEVTTFLAGQRQLQAPLDSGLAGRAWASDEPILIKDLHTEIPNNIPEENLTTLRCGVAFAIKSGDKVFGVIECFGTDLGPSEESLSGILTTVGNQISQYLQRKSAEEALLYVAAHDALTDLPNRSMFNQSLRHALIRDARYDTGVAVMVIDIDRFKIVNDTIGHSAGDRLLQECARRLTTCLRTSDIVARLGGDEFAVIVEQFDGPSDVSSVAKKVLSAMRKPFIIDEREFLLAASVGISTFPDDGEDVETLLKNADAARYRAKGEGNNYQFYSTQMNENSVARFGMETALRHAIERNEFLLYYQPKFDLRSKRITGVEALVRWQHPEMGLVSPALFIPLAEETGLIIEIGQWVLRVACAQAKVWHLLGFTQIRVAVNLSVRQFNHKHLLSDIRQTLSETGLAADSLELEITESMVMDNAEKAIKLLGEIKAMGIHLSIDDFGTGYSSLAYLRKLPVDCVKIDRAFIKDIPEEIDDMAISKSIITLGHSLRLKVVAEGVETQEQYNFLQDEGCDEIQGYLFSKPLPAGEVTTFIERDSQNSLVAASDARKKS